MLLVVLGVIIGGEARCQQHGRQGKARWREQRRVCSSHTVLLLLLPLLFCSKSGSTSAVG